MKKTSKKILAFFLTLIARGVVWRTRPKIIAVTGSVGKTSVTDAIYTILKDTESVRKSGKALHEDIGVILTIIGADIGSRNPFHWIFAVTKGIGRIFLPGKYPKILVLEVGVHRPGDTKKMARWLKPHIVVVTRLPEVPAHIEFFPTLESLIEEKLALARALRREGTLILNADDSRVLAVKEELQARTETFGMAENATIRGSNIQLYANKLSGVIRREGGGLTFKVDFDGKSFPVTLSNIYAESYVSVALASLAVAHALGINMVLAISSLSKYQTPRGRVRIITGKSSTTIIDDSYNSSPTACEAGLRMLREIPLGKRKIAILGDMLELGKHTDEEHKKIGALASERADILIAVGLRGKNFAVGAREAGMSEENIFEVDDAIKAGELMGSMLKKDDVIFVKGSQSMRMERAVKILMAEPGKADELLVRQEREWTL
jgi:UDP-N-acetylmuramyl pentapeptide synthase